MAQKSKITPVDFLINRPTRSLAILGSIAALLFWFPYTFVFVASGWLVYKILFFQRKHIFRLGLSRIYLFGLISLTPFVVALFVKYGIKSLPPDFMADFNFKTLIFKEGYAEGLKNWFFQNAEDIFRIKSGLIFSLFFGVILYVFNVEFDNRAVRKTDLAGLQITAEDLSAHNEYWWSSAFLALAIIISVIYSPVFSVILILHIFLITGLFTIKQQRIADLLLFLLLAGIGIFKFDLHTLLATPLILQGSVKILKLSGVAEAVKYYGDQDIFLKNAVVPAFAMLVQNVFNYLEIKTIKSEKSIEASVNNGVWLGHDSNKRPLIISDKELNQHCLIVGTTGSGKTTTLFTTVDSALSRRLPVIFLDGKGDKDLPRKLYQLCQKHQRRFRVFALEPEGLPCVNAYNPFSSGQFSQWKNRVMSLFEAVSGRGQEHYALSEETFLNLLCQTLHQTGKEVDLFVLLGMLEQPEVLVQVARQRDKNLADKLSMELEQNKTMAGDVLKQLDLFSRSTYGHLFDTSDKPTIKIKESIKNGDCVLFMFNASSFPFDTRRVAKMVINDIDSSFSELTGEQGHTKVFCIFDEFASYASPNLSEILSLRRSGGMHAIVGTQSISTVSLKSPETKRLAKELVACCNTYILQVVNETEDIEEMARIFGTRKTFDVTTQINSEEGGATGLGTVKFVDEFLAHPQKIRELKTGEGYILRKAANLKPTKVQFRRVI